MHSVCVCACLGIYIYIYSCAIFCRQVVSGEELCSSLVARLKPKVRKPEEALRELSEDVQVFDSFCVLSVKL